MIQPKPRIVFMGTPDFAVPSLRAIIDCNKYQVTGVVTQTDKPKGRGYQLTPSPVKVLALDKGIPVCQPMSLKKSPDSDMFIEWLMGKDIIPDIIVVVAYGKMLPVSVLNLPQFGCINVHASLLPKYRGAGPIQHAMLRGEKQTGITTMYMAEGMDTGDILMMETTDILPQDNAKTLHDRLSDLGGGIVVKTLDALVAGELSPIKQDDTKATYAPMLSKDMSNMDFKIKTADELNNQVRGLYGWPWASTEHKGKRLRVCVSCNCGDISADIGRAGEWQEHSNRLVRVCSDGTVLELLEVQPEGGKRMSVKSYLNGLRSLSKA